MLEQVAASEKGNKNPRAFTLTEVVVVMAIVSIMVGVLIVSFGKGRTERALEASAREFIGVVREAQNYALTGKQIEGNVACSFLIQWSGGGSDYTLRYTDSGNCSGVSHGIAGAAYRLKSGVTFSGSGDSNIAFALPWANIGGVLAIVFQKSGSMYVVCIDSTGKISDHSGATCP